MKLPVFFTYRVVQQCDFTHIDHHELAPCCSIDLSLERIDRNGSHRACGHTCHLLYSNSQSGAESALVTSQHLYRRGRGNATSDFDANCSPHTCRLECHNDIISMNAEGQGELTLECSWAYACYVGIDLHCC